MEDWANECVFMDWAVVKYNMLCFKWTSIRLAWWLAPSSFGANSGGIILKYSPPHEPPADGPTEYLARHLQHCLIHKLKTYYYTVLCCSNGFTVRTTESHCDLNDFVLATGDKKPMVQEAVRSALVWVNQFIILFWMGKYLVSLVACPSSFGPWGGGYPKYSSSCKPPGRWPHLYTLKQNQFR